MPSKKATSKATSKSKTAAVSAALGKALDRVHTAEEIKAIQEPFLATPNWIAPGGSLLVEIPVKYGAWIDPTFVLGVAPTIIPDGTPVVVVFFRTQTHATFLPNALENESPDDAVTRTIREIIEALDLGAAACRLGFVADPVPSEARPVLQHPDDLDPQMDGPV